MAAVAGSNHSTVAKAAALRLSAASSTGGGRCCCSSTSGCQGCALRLTAAKAAALRQAAVKGTQGCCPSIGGGKGCGVDKTCETLDLASPALHPAAARGQGGGCYLSRWSLGASLAGLLPAAAVPARAVAAIRGATARLARRLPRCQEGCGYPSHSLTYDRRAAAAAVRAAVAI